MDGAQRHGELVTDLEGEASWLCVTDMMRMRGCAAADQAGLLRDKAEVLFGANPFRLAYCKHALVNRGSGWGTWLCSITPSQIRMARAALSWSVRELAKRAGVAANTVSRFENGSGDTIRKTMKKQTGRLLGSSRASQRHRPKDCVGSW
jgi:DNA-binding XRE family transcriptional regulator